MNCGWLEIFRSVEHIWMLWGASVASLAMLIVLAVRNPTRRTWRELAKCEAGAAYTLGYVITIPFFALIVCLVIDTTLILVAKLGTVYAAYAAARSAVVWVPSGVTLFAAQSKAQLSAAMAMTPFASSSKLHQPPAGVPTFAAPLLQAHRRYAPEPGSQKYIEAKCRYAAWATDVNIQGGDDPQSDVTVTLDYRAPFHLSGIGRLLGTQSSAGFYYMNVRTVITLENHAPRCDPRNDPNHPLGISYVPSVD